MRMEVRLRRPIGLTAATNTPEATRAMKLVTVSLRAEELFDVNGPIVNRAGTSERGNPANTITDTLKLKLATAVTETTAPNTQRLRAFRRAGVFGGKEGS